MVGVTRDVIAEERARVGREARAFGADVEQVCKHDLADGGRCSKDCTARLADSAAGDTGERHDGVVIIE
jgi:hypothetical protein